MLPLQTGYNIPKLTYPLKIYAEKGKDSLPTTIFSGAIGYVSFRQCMNDWIYMITIYSVSSAIWVIESLASWSLPSYYHKMSNSDVIGSYLGCAYRRGAFAAWMTIFPIQNGPSKGSQPSWWVVHTNQIYLPLKLTASQSTWKPWWDWKTTLIPWQVNFQDDFPVPKVGDGWTSLEFFRSGFVFLGALKTDQFSKRQTSTYHIYPTCTAFRSSKVCIYFDGL